MGKGLAVLLWCGCGPPCAHVYEAYGSFCWEGVSLSTLFNVATDRNVANATSYKLVLNCIVLEPHLVLQSTGLLQHPNLDLCDGMF